MDPLCSLITQLQISQEMTRASIMIPLGKRLLFPASKCGNWPSGNQNTFKCRSYDNTIITGEIKKIPENNFKKEFLCLTGSQKYVIGLRPSVCESADKNGPKMASMNGNVSYFNSNRGLSEKNCFCWKNIGMENCIKSWQFSKNLCQSWFVTTDGIVSVWVKYENYHNIEKYSTVSSWLGSSQFTGSVTAHDVTNDEPRQ